MSRFQELIDRLAESDELLKRLEGEDGDPFLRLNSLSVKKRRGEIAAQIDEYLSARQRSLLEYRIFKAGEQRYAAKAVGGALQTFQDLLTSVYDALVNGPKKRFRPTFESVQETLLEFGGAMAGSVKIFLAADEDRRLLDDTNFQRALMLVEKTLSARTTDDLTQLSQEVGIASIAKAYSWAEHAAHNGFATELTWGQSTSGRSELTITREEAERVRALIAERSDEKTEIVKYDGILHGFDKDTSYFHFLQFGSKDHIKGDVIATMPQEVTTGVAYRATMSMTVLTIFATGEEKVRWMLMGLDAWDGDTSGLKEQ